jgi:DnaK suppressor protein
VKVTKKPAAKASGKTAAKATTKKAAAKPAAKPVAKKAAAKPVPVKKAAAKKLSVNKPAPKKTAVKKAVAKKPAPKKTDTKKPLAKKAKSGVSQAVAKKPAASKPVKPAKVLVAPASTKPEIAPIKPVETIPADTQQKSDGVKKSSRAARAAAMVPPPPAPVVASNAAKASYGPSTTPSLPTVIPVIPKKDPKLANNWKSKSVDQLSDAEVLAMPDAEYMNDTQMAYFRAKLVQLKLEILASAGETTEHLREDTVIVPDPADRATIEEEHALELRTRDRERKLLKKIEQSIQRIDAGDYGYCDETGEPIGVGRLLARPTATLSLEAQQRRELKQKMFGD